MRNEEHKAAIEAIANDDSLTENQKRVKMGHTTREFANRLKDKAAELEGEGMTNAQIAEALGIKESSVRTLVEPKDIKAEETIWFPGPYSGRQYGMWVKHAMDVPENRLIGLVEKRIKQDGNWAIENDKVGGDVEGMRRMMEWASRPDNIRQCLESNQDQNPTVDWICHELADASRAILGDIRGPM